MTRFKSTLGAYGSYNMIIALYSRLDPLSISTWFLKYRVSLDFSSISNSKKNWFWNKLNFLSSSNLIFTACVACKNQVRTRQKIEFVSKSIFLQVCNKLPNWHLKNQAQIDTMAIWLGKELFVQSKNIGKLPVVYG